MKIIIAGAGEVGCHLAKMLGNEYNDITMVDSSESRLNKLDEIADVVTVVGSPTSIATLEQAGVKNADLFIAVSPAQEQDVNLTSALLAKNLGAKKVTARINNDEYLKSENKLLFTEMGIDLLFYPEKIASAEIIDLLKLSGTTEFMEFARGLLQLVAFRLEEDAPLINRYVGDLVSESELEYKTVAISRNFSTIIPDSNTKFLQNDLVFMICTKEVVKDVMNLSGKNNIDIKRLMIVGGGKIGKLLAAKLQDSVEQIKIIEQDKEKCEYIAQNIEKVLVINGDGRNTDLLLEEDVRNIDAFVAVTNSSEANILSCVAAKKMGVSKTIAEVENFEYIKLAEGMGVDAVINKKLITAGRIFRFTLSNKVRSIKCLNGTDAEVLEFVVNPSSNIADMTLSEIKFPKEAIIGGVIRGNESFIPTADTIIKAYDRVVVFALPHTLARINKLFI